MLDSHLIGVPCFFMALIIVTRTESLVLDNDHILFSGQSACVMTHLLSTTPLILVCVLAATHWWIFVEILVGAAVTLAVSTTILIASGMRKLVKRMVSFKDLDDSPRPAGDEICITDKCEVLTLETGLAKRRISS